MVRPGEYVADVTEGVTCVEDLPKPKIKQRSRVYKKRPCPVCGHSSYRDKMATRTLHDLGNASASPVDLQVTFSQHRCSKCKKYFNADLGSLAQTGCHYTRRVVKPELSKIRSFASLESQIIHSPFLCLEPIWLLVLLGTPARKIIPLHP